ncbi:MAG TPA: serine/threonine-protein kinase [bacterium]|nr:serine/threonine-protein kinase [bacterium]
MRYERVRPLGRGATAETFLCKDLHRGGRPVAQKLFFPEWARERPDLIDREFQTLAGLAHPFIASVEDFGEEDGRPYLASEFVEGQNLIQAIRGLDVHQIVWLFLQVLEALDYLYFRNVVHLDLKPQNILVRESPSRGREVKLIDFGLASVMGRSPAGEALGTPPYTAPEFALRRGIDTRSDLYSVGVLLSEALTGRPPFEGDDPVAILNRQMEGNPRPVTGELSPFVQRLLDRDPQKRWETPRAALEGLRGALGGTSPTARAVPIPLFEDAGLILREREARDLLDGILDGPGTWTVRGEEGSGKTFLARWLERELWSLRKDVLFLRGDRIVLEAPEPSAVPPETFLLIDDADAGPVAAWRLSLPPGLQARVVLFVRDAPLEGNVVALTPLKPASLERVLKKILPGIPPSLVNAWSEAAGGSPGKLVRQGRSLVNRGKIVRDGLGWRISAGEGPSTSLNDPSERLFAFLGKAQVSLDAETLAVWTGWSVAEVEEAVADALQARRLERFFSGGRILYRSVQEEGGEAEVPPADPDAFFRTLDEEGRYEDGLDVFERHYGGEIPPSLALAKARLLAGAGRYAEVRALLTSDFISGLAARGQASALETLGKAALFEGRSPEDREQLTRAVALASAERDFDVLSRALLHLGILAQRMGDFRGAEGFYGHALASAHEAVSRDLLAGAALLNLGNLNFDAAQWPAAETFYQKCLEHLKRTRHDSVTAQAYLNLANLSFYQGRLLQAEAFAREALRFSVPRRYLPTQGRALLLLAMVDGERGAVGRQGERLSEAVFVLEAAGQTFERVVALIHRAYFREAKGGWSEAEADAREAMALAHRSRAEDLEKQAGLILGKVLAHDRKNDEEAWKSLEAACRHFSHGKNLQMGWECEFECGEFLKARGCPTEARACYERALEAVDTLTLRMPDAAREAFLRDRKREKILERMAGG